MADQFSFFSKDDSKEDIEEARSKLENLEKTLSPATIERYYDDDDWGDDYVDIPTKTITFYEPVIQETQFFPTTKEYTDKLTKATEEKLKSLETRLSESVKEIDEIQTTTISFDKIKKDTQFFPVTQQYDTKVVEGVSAKLANLEKRIEESKDTIRDLKAEIELETQTLSFDKKADETQTKFFATTTFDTAKIQEATDKLANLETKLSEMLTEAKEIQDVDIAQRTKVLSFYDPTKTGYVYEYTGADGSKKLEILTAEEITALESLLNARKRQKDSYQPLNYSTDKRPDTIVSLTNVAGFAMSTPESAKKIATILNDDVRYNADIKVFGVDQEGYGTTLLNLTHHITSEDQPGRVYGKLQPGQVINAKTGEIEQRKVTVKSSGNGVEVTTNTLTTPFKVENGKIVVYGKEYYYPVNANVKSYTQQDWTKITQGAEQWVPEPLKPIAAWLAQSMSDTETRWANNGYANKQIVEPTDKNQEWSMWNILGFVSRELSSATASALYGTAPIDINLAWRGVDVTKISDEGTTAANKFAEEWTKTGKINTKGTGLTEYDAQLLVLEAASPDKLKELISKQETSVAKLAYDPFTKAAVIDAIGTEEATRITSKLSARDKGDVTESVLAGAANEIAVNQRITGTPLDIGIAIATLGIGGAVVGVGGKITGRIEKAVSETKKVTSAVKDFATYVKDAKIDIPTSAGQMPLDYVLNVNIRGTTLVSTGDVGKIAKQIDTKVDVTDVTKIQRQIDLAETPAQSAKVITELLKTPEKSTAALVEMKLTDPLKVRNVFESAAIENLDTVSVDKAKAMLNDINTRTVNISLKTIDDMAEEAAGDVKKLADIMIKESTQEGKLGSRVVLDEMINIATTHGTVHYADVINAAELVKKLDIETAIKIPTGVPTGVSKAISGAEKELSSIMPEWVAREVKSASNITGGPLGKISNIDDIAALTAEQIRYLGDELAYVTRGKISTANVEEYVGKAIERTKTFATEGIEDYVTKIVDDAMEINVVKTTSSHGLSSIMPTEIANKIIEYGEKTGKRIDTLEQLVGKTTEEIQRIADYQGIKLEELQKYIEIATESLKTPPVNAWRIDAEKLGIIETNAGWTWDTKKLNALSNEEFNKIMKNPNLGPVFSNITSEQIANANILGNRKTEIQRMFAEYIKQPEGMDAARLISNAGIVDVNTAATKAIAKLEDMDIMGAAIELSKGSATSKAAISVTQDAVRNLTTQRISRMIDFGAPVEKVNQLLRIKSEQALQDMSKMSDEGKRLAFMLSEGELTATDRLKIWNDTTLRQLGIDAAYNEGGNALILGLKQDAIAAAKSKNTGLAKELWSELEEELKKCIARKECV